MKISYGFNGNKVKNLTLSLSLFQEIIPIRLKTKEGVSTNKKINKYWWAGGGKHTENMKKKLKIFWDPEYYYVMSVEQNFSI